MNSVIGRNLQRIVAITKDIFLHHPIACVESMSWWEEAMSKTLQYSTFAAVIAVSVLAGVNVHAKDKGSLGGQLVLKDEGIFFVHGRTILSNYPSVPATPGSFAVDQMYVQYRIPA